MVQLSNPELSQTGSHPRYVLAALVRNREVTISKTAAKFVDGPEPNLGVHN